LKYVAGSVTAKSVPWLHMPLFWWVCESPAVRQDASWFNDEQGRRAAGEGTHLATVHVRK
jgi:hypothetical protein